MSGKVQVIRTSLVEILVTGVLIWAGTVAALIVLTGETGPHPNAFKALYLKL